MELEHLDESLVSNFFNNIKDLPSQIWNKIKGKEDETIEFMEQYLLVMDNPYDGEKVFNEPYIKENEHIFKNFLKGFKISDEDKKKFGDNFKKYVEIVRKKTRIPGWFAVGFLMGFYPMFGVIVSILELIHFIKTLKKVVKEHPLYKATKEKIDKENEERRKKNIEDFKRNSPAAWNFYLKIKTYFIKKAKYTVTDEPTENEPINPIILNSTESVSILSYHEFKQINESAIMTYMIGGLAALFGWGFGRILRYNLDEKKRIYNIKVLIAKEKEKGASAEELKKLNDQLQKLNKKQILASLKIEQAKEKLREEKKTLDQLPKSKQEEAKKLAIKYEKDLKNLENREKALDKSIRKTR